MLIITIILTLIAEERTRHLDFLAADNHNTLAAQDLLGNSAGQTTEQMALGVNNNYLIE
jgi:hypothetical protein